MLYLLTTFMLMTASSHVSQFLAIDQYLDELEITNDTVFSDDEEPIQQYFFRDLAFWRFSFAISSEVDSLANPVPAPMNFAVDGNNNVYVISGGSSNNFNDLVSRFPVFVNETNLVEYGRLFLQLNQFTENMNPLFLRDSEDIQDLFQSLTDTRVKGNNAIPSDISELMSEFDPNIVVFDLLTNEYRTRNYIWLPNHRKLVFIELSVTPSGACSYLERFDYEL